MGAEQGAAPCREAARLAVAGKLAEILKYYEHLAMFLVQYAGTVCVLCASLTLSG